MKILTYMFLLVLLVCGCRRSDDSAESEGGWHDVLNNDHKPLTNIPEVHVDENNADFGLVTVRNVGRTDLTYQGSSEASPQGFNEIFDEGKWSDGPWEWCGFGLTEQKLKPGASVQMKAWYAAESYRERVYALFTCGNSRGFVLLAEESEK